MGACVTLLQLLGSRWSCLAFTIFPILDPLLIVAEEAPPLKGTQPMAEQR